MKKKVKFEPPDFKQCQVDITTTHGSFMTLGPRDKTTVRCTNSPLILATEAVAGADGQRGSMTLCGTCFEVFQKQCPGRATFKTIDPKFGKILEAHGVSLKEKT